MSRNAIEIRELSKVYRLGQYGISSLREEAERFVRKLRGKGSAEPSGDFWALRDINFEVEEGDVVGVIGRNGAGKSTLLKLISRITAPSRGEIRLRGRVAALLEVGTGFHPELTGRENIYLNGTILGMKKAEIDRKLDEIVEFSGVSRHIDTPVKRYSSGMNVRLGFAVAAHLEPDILIVDEVLAVGDLEFQKKCMNKMQDISGFGRTVLFVSHNMTSIRTVCRNAVLLAGGQIERQGAVDEVVEAYVQGSRSDVRQPGVFQPVAVEEGRGLRVTGASIESKTATYAPFQVSLEMENTGTELLEFGAALGFRDVNYTPLLQIFSAFQNQRFNLPAGAKVKLSCNLPSLDLAPGEYFLNLFFEDRAGVLAAYKSAFLVHVEDSSFERYGHLMRKTEFPVIPQAEWQTEWL